MLDAVGALLASCYALVPSYGGAIIAFSAAVMVVLAPVSFKGRRDTAAMQRLQPRLRAIQASYPDDTRSRNEALMRFYKERGSTPTAAASRPPP